MATIKCEECKGTGVVGEYDAYDPETHEYVLTTKCPWCSGTGREDVAYVVRGHGYNGDCYFTESYDVTDTVEQARASAERAFARRGDNALADGTPTLQWLEITGPGIEESLGLSENGWDGKYASPVLIDA